MTRETSTHSSAEPESAVIGAGTEDDLPAIVDILNYAIVNSNATLTTQPTSVTERRGWFERFSLTGPHRSFVTRRGNRALGSPPSQPYRDHEGFRETVEVSIALDVSSRGQGVGTALYRSLFECLADEPVHVALTGIAVPNDASIALHRKLGFTEVDTFHEYAVKGRSVHQLGLDGAPVARPLALGCAAKNCQMTWVAFSAVDCGSVCRSFWARARWAWLRAIGRLRRR